MPSKYPNQEQPEIDPRQQTGTADRRGVERGALRLDARVERVRVQDLI